VNKAIMGIEAVMIIKSNLLVVSMDRMSDTGGYISQVYIGDYQHHVWLSDTPC
jgi:hypothetical protein